MNQGRGISIFKDLTEMLDFINKSQNGHHHQHFVVQKYIEKPLLYKQRKFDIRVWAVMTTKNEIYFYKEGYLRTSSSPYNLKDHNNVYTHLTNQCLQLKDKQTYGTHEEGNTLSFDQFQEYLRTDEFKKEVPELAKYNISLEEHLIPRIQDIVIDTFCAVKS